MSKQTEPKPVSPVSELARRSGLTTPTAIARLEAAGIEPDFIEVAGSRRLGLFDLGRWDELRGILAGEIPSEIL